MATIDLHFDPAERRDVHGKWTRGVAEALSLPGSRALAVDRQRNQSVIAFGDPATADKVITYVPGIRSDTTLGDEARRAEALRQAAVREGGGKVAAVLWQGYTPPPTAKAALSKRDAVGAAGRLATFQARLHQVNPGARQTVVGHSYGSVVAGEAARTHGMRAGDLVLVGSPGTSARRAAELGPAGHVWAAANAQDPVTRIAPVLSPDFHGNPVSAKFGARVFSAATPGASFPGVEHRAAHSSYLEPGSEALPNIGAIAAGRYDRVTTPAVHMTRPRGRAVDLAGGRVKTPTPQRATGSIALGWASELRDKMGKWSDNPGGEADQQPAFRSAQVRELAGRHPGAAQHLNTAADAIDKGDYGTARTHLAAAYTTMGSQMRSAGGVRFSEANQAAAADMYALRQHIVWAGSQDHAGSCPAVELSAPAPQRAAGRRKLAAKGQALPAQGGSPPSFPIPNVDYLKRAIKSVGRAPASKRPALAALIRKRARELKATGAAGVKGTWAFQAANVGGRAVELTGPGGWSHGWRRDGGAPSVRVNGVPGSTWGAKAPAPEGGPQLGTSAEGEPLRRGDRVSVRTGLHAGKTGTVRDKAGTRAGTMMVRTDDGGGVIAHGSELSKYPAYKGMSGKESEDFDIAAAGFSNQPRRRGPALELVGPGGWSHGWKRPGGSPAGPKLRYQGGAGGFGHLKAIEAIGDKYQPSGELATSPPMGPAASVYRTSMRSAARFTAMRKMDEANRALDVADWAARHIGPQARTDARRVRASLADVPPTVSYRTDPRPGAEKFRGQHPGVYRDPLDAANTRPGLDLAFDPSQPRDRHGKWAHTPSWKPEHAREAAVPASQRASGIWGGRTAAEHQAEVAKLTPGQLRVYNRLQANGVSLPAALKYAKRGRMPGPTRPPAGMNTPNMRRAIRYGLLAANNRLGGISRARSSSAMNYARTHGKVVDLAMAMTRRMPVVHGAADVQLSRSGPGKVTVMHKSTGVKVGTLTQSGRGWQGVHASGAKTPASGTSGGAVAGLVAAHNQLARGKRLPPAQKDGTASYAHEAGDGINLAGALPHSTPANSSSDGPRTTTAAGPGGLTGEAAAIYAKLIKKGLKAGQAMAMAKRAAAMKARKAAA